MKPLKKRIQISINGKKRKINASQSNSLSRRNKSKYSSDYTSKKTSAIDSTIIDSIADENVNVSFAFMDTLIRIYYLDLNDSILNKNKAIIKSYITRIGVHKITEVSLSDFYSFEDPDKN